DGVFVEHPSGFAAVDGVEGDELAGDRQVDAQADGDGGVRERLSGGVLPLVLAGGAVEGVEEIVVRGDVNAGAVGGGRGGDRAEGAAGPREAAALAVDHGVGALAVDGEDVVADEDGRRVDAGGHEV